MKMINIQNMDVEQTREIHLESTVQGERLSIEDLPGDVQNGPEQEYDSDRETFVTDDEILAAGLAEIGYQVAQFDCTDKELAELKLFGLKNVTFVFFENEDGIKAVRQLRESFPEGKTMLLPSLNYSL